MLYGSVRFPFHREDPRENGLICTKRQVLKKREHNRFSNQKKKKDPKNTAKNMIYGILSEDQTEK